MRRFKHSKRTKILKHLVFLLVHKSTTWIEQKYNTKKEDLVDIIICSNSIFSFIHLFIMNPEKHLPGIYYFRTWLKRDMKRRDCWVVVDIYRRLQKILQFETTDITGFHIIIWVNTICKKDHQSPIILVEICWIAPNVIRWGGVIEVEINARNSIANGWIVRGIHMLVILFFWV